MTVDGDVDDGIQGSMQLRAPIRGRVLRGGGHVGEQRGAGAAGDEHAIAEAEAGLVRVVEPLEFGGDVPAKLKDGAYVNPTLFTGVKNSMSIAQQEIFGPVASVIEFNGVDEAIRIANDTIYGLASAAWTRVGPDFALRMGATPPPVPQGAPGNVISFPLVPKPQGQGVWAEVQAALHAENPALYATWFAALLAVEGPGGRLSLRAPSRFHAAFLTTHHLARIRELVQARAPEVTTVSIDA